LRFGCGFQIGLFAVINLHDQPGLAALLEEDETLEDLRKLSPEQLLLRWVNYQLRQSGCDRHVTNLTTDIRDSVVYIHLINQIAPPELGLRVNTDAELVRTFLFCPFSSSSSSSSSIND